jgi:5'-3' exonuclease
MWYENGEADDIAGWLSTALRDKPNILYSKDKDWLMLVDENTTLLYKNTKKGLYVKVTLENFEEETSWKTPEEFLLAKCAIGDTGDNVPGIRGIGPQTVRKYLEGRAPKTATLILDEFYSGSDLLKHNLKMMDIRACVIEKPLFKKAGCYSEERVLSLLAEKGFASLLKRSRSWMPNIRILGANLSNTA